MGINIEYFDDCGDLFASLMDKDGQPYKDVDGRVHLYER